MHIRLFFTALMFYTRIPAPKSTGHSEEMLNRCTRYFPVIGWIVGTVSALSVYLFMFIIPISMAILLSMTISIWITGAFHEDGWADVCDGFGGGWTREKILDIMKDSRLGTFGTIGLVFMLALKYLSLTYIKIDYLPYILIAGHSLSRLMAVSIIYTSSYARADETSKVKPLGKQMLTGDFLFALLTGIIPMLLLPDWYFMLLIIPLILVTWYLKYYFEKWLGGFTGDCLGATQQINELLFYIGSVVLCKYI